MLFPSHDHGRHYINEDGESVIIGATAKSNVLLRTMLEHADNQEERIFNLTNDIVTKQHEINKLNIDITTLRRLNNELIIKNYKFENKFLYKFKNWVKVKWIKLKGVLEC